MPGTMHVIGMASINLILPVSARTTSVAIRSIHSKPRICSL
jgi:hypothetical protein